MYEQNPAIPELTGNYSSIEEKKNLCCTLHNESGYQNLNKDWASQGVQKQIIHTKLLCLHLDTRNSLHTANGRSIDQRHNKHKGP